MDEVEPRATSRGPRNIDRKRIHAFIERHLLTWDLTMAALALLFLGIGFVEDHPIGGLTENSLAPVELAITLVFLA
jgi:hypothetical protein